MMGLDLRSVILMSGIMGVLLSVVMLFLRQSYPKSIRGLGFWAAAPVITFLSTLLLGARGDIPALYSIVGANLVLLTGVSLFHFGIQHFYGLKPSYGLWLGIIGATIPPLVWFSQFQPDFNARVMLVCSVWAALMLSMARTVWRHGREVFSTRYTVLVLLFHASVILLRLLSAALPLPSDSLFDPSRIQTLYIGTNALIVVALGVGFILMAADRLREEFEHAATHDSLTHVLVRRTLLEVCEQELARCHRHGRSMALLMMDIDHFKAINDTHGHQMGDRVLVDFVERVKRLLRRPDQLGRFGGEEFVLLLPETTQEEAIGVAERIREAVAAPAAGLPPITVSIGVAANRPDDAHIDVLLARADKALYKAKAEGRNRIAEA